MKDNDEGEAEKMSARKRRNMLVGFGAVAIVLAVAVAYFAPNFNYRDADASGAIGAVEKHRAPQIAQNDVVLGDEQTKREQQIVYADFLTDAAALQNAAADLQSEEQAIGVRALNVAKRLEMRQADLNVRYRQAADEFLASLEQLGAAEHLGRAAFLEMRENFNLAALPTENVSLNARAMDVVNQLGIAPCCGRALHVRSLEQMESAIGSADAASLAAAARAADLRAAFDADNLGARIQAYARYMDALANESAALGVVARNLQVKSLDARALAQASASVLNAAEQLEASARDSMAARVASDEAILGAMNRMEARVAAANSLDATSRNALNAFAEDLQSRRQAYEVRSQYNLRGRLASIDAHLAARNELGRRALASMGESNLAAFAQEIGAKAQAR